MNICKINEMQIIYIKAEDVDISSATNFLDKKSINF